LAVGIKDDRDQAVDSMSLASAMDAYNKFNGSFDNRLQLWFSAGSPRGAPISEYQAIGELAQSKNIGITMHCAEAPKDKTIYQEHYGCTPLQFCQKANLTSKKTVLAHVVHPHAETDFEILAATGTTVSHNPTSNCKLGSGISPIPKMLLAGVNVSLGTDGAPCNNTYDMIQEMHLASILHSGAREQAGIVSSYQVLEMATINGARALGLDHAIGSLEIDKKADFAMIDPSHLSAAPWDPSQVVSGGCDPVTIVVHSCTSADVEMVVIDGKILVQNGELVESNEHALMQEARIVAQGLRKRSGVSARNPSNLRYI
jgi:cytosine/adenosine deaminase-related metal-dependent hydrolase